MVDHAELRLPLEMSPMIVVDPGWTSTPLELDGIFLGYREESEHLRFLAVGEDGTLLWQADRPLTCTGFSLTRGADGAAVAVLADAAPTEDALAMMTLTAYDLHSAQPHWGPVEHRGPRPPSVWSTRNRRTPRWGRAGRASRCPVPPASRSWPSRISAPTSGSSASTWEARCASPVRSWC